MRSNLFVFCVCHLKNYLLYLYLYLYFLYFEKLSFVFVSVFVFFVFWRGEQGQKYFEVLDGILEGGKTKNTVRLIEIQSEVYVFLAAQLNR